MLELEPELIKLALFIVGVSFLLLMKSFWDELQEDNEEFYPDGLDQCPQETYTLDEHGSSRVKCISCPQCPAGTEPTPPCGKTLAVKLTGECVPCGKGSFSDEASSAACKACFDCGSREVVSSCTTDKDAECKECPSSYYEDQMTHGCKHCSFCCGRNTAAHLECIRSKMCKGNCSQMAKFKRKYTYSIFSKLAANAMNNSHDATSVSTSYSLQKNRQERSIQHENTNTDNPTLSEIIKKDMSFQVADGEANTNSNSRETRIIFDSIINKQLTGKESKDLQFFRRPGISNSTQKEKTDNQRIQLDKESNTSMKNYLQNNAANAVETDGRPVSTTLQPTAFPPTPPTNQFENMMPPTQVPMQMPLAASRTETQEPPLINKSSFLSSFSGTITAFVVLGLIGIIVYIIVRKCATRPRGYKKLNSCTYSPGEQQTEYDDAVDEASTKDEMECSTEETASEMFHRDDAAKVMADLNLGEIPPDLEDILVVELDVTHGRGKNKVFGWQKVGNAAGIPRRELKYYQNEYLRPNGSPTKLLLDKLGSQGKTISYLLDVLQKPRVQLGGVAASIRHRVTTV